MDLKLTFADLSLLLLDVRVLPVLHSMIWQYWEGFTIEEFLAPFLHIDHLLCHSRSPSPLHFQHHLFRFKPPVLLRIDAIVFHSGIPEMDWGLLTTTMLRTKIDNVDIMYYPTKKTLSFRENENMKLVGSFLDFCD